MASPRTFFAAAALAVICGTARAQGVADCEGALIPNSANAKLSVADTMSLVQLVNEDNWSQAKKSLANNSQMIVYGIPIKGDTSYDQFDESRRRFMSEYRFTGSHVVDSSWSTTYLSAVAGNAYAKCLSALTNAKKVIGAYVWAEGARPDSKDIVIRFKYVTSSSDVTPRTASLTTSSGRIEIDDEVRKKLKGFPGGVEGTVTLRRDTLDEDVIVILNVGGDRTDDPSDPLIIPAMPRIERHAWEGRNAIHLKGKLKASGGLGSQHPNTSRCFTAGDLAKAVRREHRDKVDQTDVRFVFPQDVPKPSITGVRDGGGDGDKTIRSKVRSPYQFCVTADIGIDEGLNYHWIEFDAVPLYEREVWEVVKP